MRLTAEPVCWSVVAGAAVIDVLGTVSDAPVLVGQAAAAGLAALAVIALLGNGRGRLAVAAGAGILAVDALVFTQDLRGTHYLSPFYEPLTTGATYSLAADLAWLGAALPAQLTEHWRELLGICLSCAGTVMTLADRSRTEARWPRWIGWAVVAGVTFVLLGDVGGGPPARRLVTLGVLVPTMAAVAAGLAVLMVAAGRRWRSGVPAAAGALLLTTAVLGANLANTGPARPVVRYEIADAQFLQSGYRLEEATAIGHGWSPGPVTTPLLALLPILAIALLVLAAPGRGGSGIVRPAGPDRASS